MNAPSHLLPSPPALLCDEMLLGLGKWLRAAGYDTAMPGMGVADRKLVEQAIAENRLLLTCDRSMVQIRRADGVIVLLQGSGMPAWVRELARLQKGRPGIDWLLAPFSRCLLCNTPLQEHEAHKGLGVPAWVVRQGLPTWSCPDCKRIYWHGGHVQRMLARLQEWQSISAQVRGSGGQDASSHAC